MLNIEGNFDALLLFAALILFILAALPLPVRVGLGWLGAACATLAFLI